MKKFLKDRILSELNIDSFDIISFDIFDTLLFRACASAEDIFCQTGDKIKEKHKNFIYSGKTFWKLRIEAEKKARKIAFLTKGNYEINLADIYNQLPFEESLKKEFASIEFEVEQENIYLNRNMYLFLKYCYDQGKTIVFLSDMYLSKALLEKLLIASGVERKYLKYIYISNEQEASKSSGKLYRKIKEDFSDYDTKKIFHIGDHYISDVLNAKKEGIQAVHYDIIPESFNSMYKMERLFSEELPDEIRSLRKLTGNAYCYKQKSENTAYKIGAEILGPVYVLFTEWILEYAKQNNIEKLFPLMRDGYVFEKLLNNSIENENLELKVSPLYISRRSSFLPIANQLDKELIESLMLKQGLSLNGLFQLIGINILETPFAKYQSLTVDECKQSKPDLIEELEKYLLEDRLVDFVNHHIHSQKNLLEKYLSEQMGQGSAATIDIGFDGTIQHNFKDLRDLENTEKTHHLLLAATSKVAEKIIQGTPILGWLGMPGENEKVISEIKRCSSVIESLSGAPIGSTFSYEKAEGKVQPVLGDHVFSKQQLRYHEICLHAILNFQKEWFSFKEEFPYITSSLLKKKSGFLAIIQRLIYSPSYEESLLFEELIQDESFNISNRKPIITTEELQLLKDMGTDQFIKKTVHTYYPYKVSWPAGVVAKAYPQYFVEQFLIQSAENPIVPLVFETMSKIAIQYKDGVSIYGAGVVGKLFVDIAKMANLNIDSIVDKNAKLHGQHLDGIRIVSLNEATNKTKVYFIASFAFIDEIKDTILNKYPSEDCPVIIDFQ